MNENVEAKPIAKRRGRKPHHTLTFWIGVCLGVTGFLLALGVKQTVIGRMDISQIFSFILILGALVLFGIAWHLAGDQVGIDTHEGGTKVRSNTPSPRHLSQ